jgi:raffinose/stachyose/melibiose transport system substrate-binding protein
MTANESLPCLTATTVDSFNEASTTVEVTVVQQANQWDALRPALAAGVGPDIVQTPGVAYVSELVLAGQLGALDEFASEFGWDDIFVPWALTIGRLSGKLYSLSDSVETLILWYNKTVFEQNGWQPPATVDELLALCAKIEAAGIIPFAGQAGECQPCNEWYFGEFVNHMAGPARVYEALKGQVPWTHADFVESITIQSDIVKKGWIMGSVEKFLAATFDEFSTAFATGKAAMNMEGDWFYVREAEYFTDDNPHEWDWTPVPSKTGKPIFDLGLGHTWSINAASTNPRAAAEYLTSLYSPELQVQRYKDCRWNIGPIKIKVDEIEGLDPRISRLLAEFSKAQVAGDYGYTTWTFWPPKSNQYLQDEIEKVWVGQLSPSEYLEGLDAIFAEELAAGKVPPLPVRG